MKSWRNNRWPAEKSLVVTPDISCSILLIAADKVRLGIHYPPSIEVHRKEIYDKLHGTT